jgi:hypothetical protein
VTAPEPTEVVVAGKAMPTTRTVLAEMREHLAAQVRRIREERGEVHLPEDVFPGVVELAATIDGLDEYAHAFKVIRSEVVAFIGDELEDAVGEQDGIPNSGLKVPAPDGTTVLVDVDAPNSYSFDVDALTAAVATWIWGDVDPDCRTQMIEAMRALLELGSFTPGIRKVQAFKDELSRVDPKLASTITWQKTSTFKGIKVKREQPKTRRTR